MSVRSPQNLPPPLEIPELGEAPLGSDAGSKQVASWHSERESYFREALLQQKARRRGRAGGAEQHLPILGTFWGDRLVPPVGACGGPFPVTALCHLEGNVTTAIVINSSGLIRTTDRNRKCFLFISCKHSYRKLRYLGQEAEVTEDRDRTASRV